MHLPDDVVASICRNATQATRLNLICLAQAMTVIVRPILFDTITLRNGRQHDALSYLTQHRPIRLREQLRLIRCLHFQMPTPSDNATVLHTLLSLSQSRSEAAIFPNLRVLDFDELQFDEYASIDSEADVPQETLDRLQIMFRYVKSVSFAVAPSEEPGCSFPSPDDDDIASDPSIAADPAYYSMCPAATTITLGLLCKATDHEVVRFLQAVCSSAHVSRLCLDFAPLLSEWDRQDACSRRALTNEDDYRQRRHGAMLGSLEKNARYLMISLHRYFQEAQHQCPATLRSIVIRIPQIFSPLLDRLDTSKFRHSVIELSCQLSASDS